MYEEHKTLNDLDLKALKVAAEYFGVDLEGVRGKLNVIQALEDNGVDITMYNQWQARLQAEKPAEEVHDAGSFEAGKPEPVDPGKQVVLKMERQNLAYDTFGVTFTREHPFAIVSEDTAQQILDNEEGFRIALQRELEDYYS